MLRLCRLFCCVRLAAVVSDDALCTCSLCVCCGCCCCSCCDSSYPATKSLSLISLETGLSFLLLRAIRVLTMSSTCVSLYLKASGWCVLLLRRSGVDVVVAASGESLSLSDVDSYFDSCRFSQTGSWAEYGIVVLLSSRRVDWWWSCCSRDWVAGDSDEEAMLCNF